MTMISDQIALHSVQLPLLIVHLVDFKPEQCSKRNQIYVGRLKTEQSFVLQSYIHSALIR